jgi:long-chain acyl-CoA synthetase
LDADGDSGRVLWQGETGGSGGAIGEIQIRGPQVCQGYWQDEATTAAQRATGWWRTGDLGAVDAKGRLAIRGRCKDTIVLSGGENVEPVPIEDRLRRSPLIHSVVVVGQDRKHLAALVQLDLAAAGEQLGFQGDHADAATDETMHQAVSTAIRELVNQAAGFKRFELVPRCAILPEPLHVGRDLTNLLKIRRHIVHDHWADLIESCYG